METLRDFHRAIFLSLLTTLLSACAVLDAQKPKVQVDSVRYQHVSLKAGRLDTRLSVTNPNNFKLPLKALNYQLYLNDKEFVSGKTDQVLELAAAETRQIELPIAISYQKVVESLGSAVMNGKLRFRVKGELDFGLIRVPYQQTGEFKLY